jgi:hypothetical protein
MKNRIATGLALIGILAISIMHASAGLPYVFDGNVLYSNGSGCLNIDNLKITNLNTSAEWNKSTIPQLIYSPGDSYYTLTLEEPENIGNGNILQYFAQCGVETNTSTRTYTTGISIVDYNITLNAPAGQPDLSLTYVWDNPDKGGYLFANETDDIMANINNSGSADAGSFDVTLEIDSYTETKSVASLAAGANMNVTFTGYAPTSTGTRTVNITADKENAIAESNESNNLLSTSRTVYNNGYKGKRWTGGADIITVETYDIKGNVTYSTGSSAYTSGGYTLGDGWKSISAAWTSSDLAIPSSAAVLSARLYVYYNWDVTGGALWGDNTTFNSVKYSKASATHYSDVKGWGSYSSNTYGTLVYNVTSNFNKSGNTVNLGDGINNRTVSIDGIILQVVYSDASEPRRMIWINEGYDLFNVNPKYGTDPSETIAYAPFTGGPSIDTANAASARLIAVGPGAGDTTANKSNVIFNSIDHWNVLPPYRNPTQIGIADIDVTSELEAINTAAIQDNGDTGGMRAATTVLVVEQKPGIRIDLGGYYDTEVGRRIMVPIKANGFEKSYGTVEMNFSYNPAYFHVVAVRSSPQSTVTAYHDYDGIEAISAWNTVGVKGDVVLATVELEVVAGKGNSSPLGLTVDLLQDIYGAAINSYTENATVNIGNPGILAVTSATSIPQSLQYSSLEAILNDNGRARHTGDNETLITAIVTDSGLGINSVTVNLSAIGGSAAALMSETSPGSLTYTVNAKATAGINLTHSFVVTARDNGGNTAANSTNSLTIYRRGDVSRNNIVDMGDALYIARYTVGMQTITDMNKFNFVGDLMPAPGGSAYTVDMGDALYIARHSVGLEPAP